MIDRAAPRNQAALIQDLARFNKQLSSMDERAGDILTYQGALKLEVTRLLVGLLPRGQHTTGLAFSHKITLLRAAWFGDADRIDALANVLKLFLELRNSIAHGDKRRLIDRWIERISVAYEALPGSDESHVGSSLRDIVSDLCGTIAGITREAIAIRPPNYPVNLLE